MLNSPPAENKETQLDFFRYGEYSDPEILVKSGKYDLVYRFAVESPPVDGTFSAYISIGVNEESEGPICDVYKRFIHNRSVLVHGKSILNREESKDLINAINLSEFFSLVKIQDFEEEALREGETLFTAEVFKRNERIQVKRMLEVSSPADFLSHFLIREIPVRMKALDY